MPFDDRYVSASAGYTTWCASRVIVDYNSSVSRTSVEYEASLTDDHGNKFTASNRLTDQLLAPVPLSALVGKMMDVFVKR